jgi:hypothetical protein
MRYLSIVLQEREITGKRVEFGGKNCKGNEICFW